MSTYGLGYPQTLNALLPPPGPEPAVTDERGTLDRTAFHAGIARVAGALRGAGVDHGDRVALWLPNGVPYLLAIFACARLGALAVHVNTRFRGEEVGSLLRRSRAAVLVTDWGFSPVGFPAILEGLPGEDRAALRRVLGVNVPPGTVVAGLPVTLLDGADPDRSGDAGAADAPCLTFTTSGTTSGPKLVLHDQGTIAGHAADVARGFGLDAPGAVLLGAVPFCGTFGNAAAMAALYGRAHVVCMGQFDGAAAAALIRRHGVTHTVGGDDMYGRIAAAGGRFGTMRLGGFGAFQSTAAASVAAADGAGLRPHGVYGSSEVQALFSVSRGANRLLGGGVPVGTGVQLSVRDPDSGVPLPPGASGELWIKAPSVFGGYMEDEVATARAFGADGFFRTGDLARLDGDGFVYEARIGDAMRLGGFLVSPEEIEGFLQAQPGVAAVQVVGASAGGDLVPVAFVLAAPGTVLDETVLRAACRDKLARYKVPARIVALDAFPVVQSANGPKVQRHRLRAMAETLLRAVQAA